MRADVAAAAGARVAVRQVAQPVQHARPGPAVDGIAQRLALAQEELQQADEMFGVPQAFEVGLGEADVAVAQRACVDPVVVDAQAQPRRQLALAEAMRAACVDAAAAPRPACARAAHGRCARPRARGVAAPDRACSGEAFGVGRGHGEIRSG